MGQPTLKAIKKIEGVTIYHGWLDLGSDAKEIIQFTAKMHICCDGVPKNVYGDPHWNPKTAYRGPLNADKIPYVVVPPFIIGAVDPVVLGSECEVHNTVTNMTSDAICGEVGPQNKLGEGSCELARRLGLNPNPNHGGTSKKVIVYTIFIGEAAVIDGIKYKLQPS
jgi:hypothetical protein